MPDIDAQDFVSLVLLILGVVVACYGLARYARAAVEGHPQEGEPSPRIPRSAWIAAVALSLIAVGVGLENIQGRGISHTEVYAPNVDLPPDISVPPPRHTLRATLSESWHIDSHPPAYVTGMWGWTSIFGTSLVAIRLPSVLAGGIAVLLMFRIGTGLFGVGAGLTAAALLAFNGHHSYWMQQARGYELAMVFALVATGLWMRLLKRGRGSVAEEVGYVLAGVAGTYTKVYFWPLWAGQMLATLIARARSDRPLPRVFHLQTLVVIIGAPTWAHAVRATEDFPRESASLAFAQDFVNFGFLFEPDTFSLVTRTGAPWLVELAITIVAASAVIFFVRTREYRVGSAPAPDPLPTRLLVPVALGFAVIVWALAREAHHRNTEMSFVILMPLLALASYYGLARWAGRSAARGDSGGVRASPVAVSVFISSGLILALGLFVPFMVSRGMLVLLPGLLLVLAPGMWAMVKRAPPLGWSALAFLAFVSVWSVAYYRGIPGPNDYRGLAAQLNEERESSDLIFVRNKDWATSPLFYYLTDAQEQLVGYDYSAAVATPAVHRVWVVLVSGARILPEMADGLRAFAPVDSVSALRMRALLYQRDD